MTDTSSVAGEPARETLDDIEAEISEQSLEWEHEQAPPPPPQPDAQTAALVAGMFLALGNVICARAGVDLITHEEAQMVGQAGANVAAQYNVKSDPRVIAWAGLAGALAAVSLPRLEQARVAREKALTAPEKRSEPDAPAAAPMPMATGSAFA